VLRWWLLLVVLIWPFGAAGAEEAVRFRYGAPHACPEADAFVARVRERTARGRLAAPEELARTFRVAIAEDAGGFLGRIEFLDDAGAAVSRSVRGEQCDAVVSSLALITALALDATLDEDSRVLPLPVMTSSSPRPRPARHPPKWEPPRAFRATASPPRRVTSMRIGLTGGYAGAVHAPSLGLLGQLDFRGGWALRLAAHYGWDDFVADDQGRRAKLRTQGIETSVCPWRYGPRDLAIAPCALLDLGYLHVAGVRDSQLTSASGQGIFWAAAGAELRLAWEPRSAFWAEIRVAGLLPLRQGYRFTFENPRKDAYLAPPFAASAGLSGGVRFW
jgi:hypothetical protein